eukprot:3125981-Pleurochrysis_carterae.AAC.1
MPHADLVMASGSASGSLIRIQTFSPQHLVVVRADFCNCVHGNVAPPLDYNPVPGLSQLRLLHYSQTEINRICSFYDAHPGLDLFAEERGAFWQEQRLRLGCPHFPLAMNGHPQTCGSQL